MVQNRLRVVKWLSTTPAIGVCTLCSREFKVPMSALKKTADAQASLQEQFDRHKCEAPRLQPIPVRVNADVLLRQEPGADDDEDADEEEEEDDRKKEDDDEDESDGYSE